MKIGILTHYDVNNQGALLQLYALYNYFKELGHEPVVLTFNKNFDFSHHEKTKNQIGLSSVSYILKNYLLKKGIGLTFHNTRKYITNKKFRLSRMTHEDYSSTNADVIVVGSDEVFSIPHGINFMMYGYGALTDQFFAYAPSFGQTSMRNLNDHHCKGMIATGLKGFIGLSGRDIQTCNLIRELTDREVQLVCDPVLLYDFADTKTEVRRIRKKYLLVYAYDRNFADRNEIAEIKNYAKTKGYITVSAGTYHNWCDENIVCDPLEWLEYFRNAEEIITDTFHGAILSIITEKRTAYYLRDININKLHGLLSYFELDSRIISSFSTQEIERIQDIEMNYLAINKKLTQLRSLSKRYISETLSYVKVREE